MVKLLGFAGRMGVGKSFAARHLVATRAFAVVKFAAPLKAMVAALYRAAGMRPLDIVRRIEGPLKELPDRKLAQYLAAADAATWPEAMLAALAPGMADRNAMPVQARDALLHVAETLWRQSDCSPRIIMQTLGTQWGRELLGEDFWVDRWQDAALAALRRGVPGIVADDVRFANEAGRIRELGGRVILIRRAGQEGDGAAAHVSEAIDIVADAVVDNDGTADFLRRLAIAA